MFRPGVLFERSSALTLDPAMFSGIALPDNSATVSFAGIHGSTRNSNPNNNLDFNFDRFCINEPEGTTNSLTISAQVQGRNNNHSGTYEIVIYQSGEATPWYSGNEVLDFSLLSGNYNAFGVDLPE